jgi:hypothetical protein
LDTGSNYYTRPRPKYGLVLTSGSGSLEYMVIFPSAQKKLKKVKSEKRAYL